MARWGWVNFQCQGVLLCWIRVGQGPRTKRWSGNIKEWTGLGLKMKSDQGWKGIVAMALQGYGIEYDNRFPKNMYSVFSEV